MIDEKTPLASSFNRHKGSEDEDDDRAVSPPPAVVVSSESGTLSAELKPMSASDNTALLTPDGASANSDSIRSPSPVLTVSPPPETAPSRPLSPVTTPTPVSGDIILPLMIFAVVKANPPHLVSHLLYTQRFRRERAAGGEEGYCLVNLMAVAEFLENVDLAALGLGESEKMVIRYVLAPPRSDLNIAFRFCCATLFPPACALLLFVASRVARARPASHLSLRLLPPRRRARTLLTNVNVSLHHQHR